MLEISQSEFERALHTRVAVVDFFASWCMPCVMMGDVLENLSQKYNDANFVKINIERSPDISQKFEISSLPCVVLFVDGKEVDRINGNVPEDFIEEKIKRHLK